MGRRILTIALVAAFVFAFAPPAAPWQPAAAKSVDGGIPDHYIVVLKEGVTNPQDIASEMARTYGLAIKHTYGTALKGFSAAIPAQKLQAVQGDPRVAFVSQDRVIGLAGPVAVRPDKSHGKSTQIIPTGISRIGINSTNQGTGIGVAVIDTGIDLSHPDLVANIVGSYSALGGTGDDDNGHGSHVAGTIAALNNKVGVVGVAPEAKLIAVKVLDQSGYGSFESVIAGIDWVTANAAKYNIKIANMSLGGSGSSDNNCGNTNSDALHKAICKSVAAGITYVVAAGNNGGGTNAFVPAAYNDAVITVTALVDTDGKPGGLGPGTSYGADDTFANFSNYGSAVDLGAPGVNIRSTWKNGGYNTISGTSMATPHVSGAAALYLKSHPGATWQQVRDGLIAVAEPLDSGHTDPSWHHPESVVHASSL